MQCIEMTRRRHVSPQPQRIPLRPRHSRCVAKDQSDDACLRRVAIPRVLERIAINTLRFRAQTQLLDSELLELSLQRGSLGGRCLFCGRLFCRRFVLGRLASRNSLCLYQLDDLHRQQACQAAALFNPGTRKES